MGFVVGGSWWWRSRGSGFEGGFVGSVSWIGSGIVVGGWEGVRAVPGFGRGPSAIYPAPVGIWASIAVAFVGAFAAFTLGEVAVRVRRRRELVEEAAMNVSLDLAHFVTGLTTAGAQMDRSVFSPWHASRNRVIHNLTLIRKNAKWIRDAGKIREEAEDLLARIGLVMSEMQNGNPIPPAGVLLVMDNDLQDAVFGEHQTLVDRTEWYREHGLDNRYPGD